MSSFSTSNVKDTNVMAFFSGAGVVNNAYEQTFDWRRDQTAAIRKAPMAGIPNLGTWDGKANLDQVEPDALDPQTMSYVIFAVQARLSMFDKEEVPDLEAETLRKIGFSAASTVASAAAAAKAAAFTTVDVNGGKTMFALDHATRSSALRPNRINAAMDRATILLATNMIEKYPNYDDQVNDLSGGGYFLEYPTELKERAKQATMSAVTSSQGQINAAAQEDFVHIRNPYLSDANNWMVSVRAPGFKPWLAWLRKALMVVMDWDRYNMRTNINVVIAVGFGNKGVPEGAVGGAVA